MPPWLPGAGIVGRSAYPTAILSNGSAGGRREEEKRYGFAEMVDLLVYSYEEGMEKPDHRTYQLTCERLGVRPQEAVFLDDLEVNVVAAREVGMHAVLFQRTTQAISDVEACLAALLREGLGGQVQGAPLVGGEAPRSLGG